MNEYFENLWKNYVTLIRNEGDIIPLEILTQIGEYILDFNCDRYVYLQINDPITEDFVDLVENDGKTVIKGWNLRWPL